MLGASAAGGSACLLTDLVRAEFSTCRRQDLYSRVAPPIHPSNHGRHEQTWARRSDLKPSAPQRLCIHVRFRGTALIQSTSLAQTGATTDRFPQYPSAASTTHHIIHLAIKSRGTHARFVHACTLEPPGGRRANELSLPCHVVALDVQSQVRSGSAARTVCSTWRG